MMTLSIDVAIIGAGPYGLSLAAHLDHQKIDYRIFGKPMAPWKDNMPSGMLLKSYPWASNLSDPHSQFTVRQYCVEQEMPYHDTLMALSIESFIAYGEAFRRRFVPNVEQKMVARLEKLAVGFRATFDDDEAVTARHVILAVGVGPFKHIPDILSGLPGEILSHSGDYGPIDTLRNKQVIVLGSGASASDLAALLHEQGTAVSLLARGEVNFAAPPRRRSLFEELASPTCGIGHGWVLRACSNAPWLVHMLPESTRLRLAKVPRALGGAFMKERVASKVPVLSGRAVDAAECSNGKVRIRTCLPDGTQQTLEADHLVSATGYKIDVPRLGFLDPYLLWQIHCADGTPVLSTKYESSVPGLYFIGPASAASFGPVSRFVFGATYPAKLLARHLSARLGRRSTQTTKSPEIVPALR
jgi:lysine/ornithine N-monooxygenase